MCMCVYIYVSLCVWVCVCECMCECVGDCVYVCMYATVYMYVCVTMSVYICVTVCVYSLHTGTQMLVCECTWVWKPEIRRRHHSSASSHPLHYLRQGFNWPEACWLHEPSCLRNSKAPTFLYLPSSGIANMFHRTQIFQMNSRDQTHVLEQMFYWHLFICQPLSNVVFCYSLL